MPVKEEQALLPLHPYGISKVCLDLLAREYFLDYGVKTVNLRLFNTTGPGKTGDAPSDFVRQLARIKKGLQQPLIEVGNLKPHRAFLDVRDTVHGFYLAALKGRGERLITLCAPSTISIGNLLRTAIGLSGVKAEIRPAPHLMRPSDEKIIFGSTDKIRMDIGWKSTFRIEQTLQSMLDYWNRQLSALVATLSDVIQEANEVSVMDSSPYVLITPARNEERFLASTIESMVKQTELPARWVIVNDGSTDSTARIVRRYLADHPWMELVDLPVRTERNFAAKVYAFNAGRERVKDIDYEMIGNLDADVSLEEDHFEFLLTNSRRTLSLGLRELHSERMAIARRRTASKAEIMFLDSARSSGGAASKRSAAIERIKPAELTGWQ